MPVCAALRNGDAQQAQLAGLLHQSRHQSLFKGVDAFQVRPHLRCEEVGGRLRDHALFLIELLGDEDVLWIAGADQELAALQGFLVGSAHGSFS